MLKKQLEQGKLAATGTSGGVAVPGVVPGLMVASMQGQISGQPAPIHQPVQNNMQEVSATILFNSQNFLSIDWRFNEACEDMERVVNQASIVSVFLSLL